MPEGRMLKKAINDSRKLPLLSSDTYRLLYTWMIPWLDIEGRFSAEPNVIKGHIVPRIKKITEPIIDKALLEMHEMGLIMLYNIDGDRFLQFTKFKDHQKIDLKREAPSRILPVENGIKIELSASGQRVVAENSPVIKGNIIEGNIDDPATSKEVALFPFIHKYFTSSYKKRFGKEPAIDFGKDGKQVKAKQSLFTSPEEAYELIDEFIGSKKAEECGYTLSVCFSSHTINLWRAGQLGNKQLTTKNW